MTHAAATVVPRETQLRDPETPLIEDLREVLVVERSAKFLLMEVRDVPE